MYCKNCHTEIEPGQKFCTECGAPVCSQHSSHDSVKHPTGKFSSHSPSRKMFSKSKIIGIIAAAFLCSIVLYMCGDDSDEYMRSPNVSAPKATIIATSPTEKSISTIPEVTEKVPLSNYISRAITVAEKEYPKFKNQQAISLFMREAIQNNITLDMLNRQPEYYVGKKVYFGGTVSQVINDPDSPDYCRLRVKVNGTGASNSHIFVVYTLKQGENRILEDDYVDVYGIFKGLLTYESVIGSPVTVPQIDADYLYCTAITDGSVITPSLKEFQSMTSGNFLSEDGNTFSFSTVKNGADNYFADATDYDDCIVAYFLPNLGWDSNNPPPFYRVTVFRDGTMVIFEPNPNAEAGVYSPTDGIYTQYTKCDTVPSITTHPVEPISTEPPPQITAPVQTTSVGYVSPSSGGLKIRSGPSTDYQEVGRLSPCEEVTIYETDSDGSRDWGRIDRGWICMDYIVWDKPSQISTSSGYSAVLSQYRTAIANGYQSYGSYVNDTIPILRQWGSEFDIYYAQVDLNSDGIYELLIGGRDITSISGIIDYLDLFTLSNNVPVRIVDNSSLGHRAQLQIYTDGTFAVSGSSGASTGGTELYQLQPYSSVPTLIEQYGTQDGIPYYSGPDGDVYPISEEELDSFYGRASKSEINVSWVELY